MQGLREDEAVELLPRQRSGVRQVADDRRAVLVPVPRRATLVLLAAAVGYAEGGLLARGLGAWQTVSWALVLASPLMVSMAAYSMATQPPTGTAVQWAAFAYLGAVSMFLGFFAWYHGLAIGPMTQVSQIQLVQPVLSICWAGLILGEHLTWTTIAGGAAVVLCAGLAVRSRTVSARLGSTAGATARARAEQQAQDPAMEHQSR